MEEGRGRSGRRRGFPHKEYPHHFIKIFLIYFFYIYKKLFTSVSPPDAGWGAGGQWEVGG